MRESNNGFVARNIQVSKVAPQEVELNRYLTMTTYTTLFWAFCQPYIQAHMFFKHTKK